MNKNLKELEKQCWTHRVDGILVDGQLHFDADKFAELIVRECIAICISNALEDLDADDRRGSSAKAAFEIKEHFDIE